MFFSSESNFIPLFTEKQMEVLLPKGMSGCMSAYNDGYKTGLTWPDKWKSHGEPGGPWVYGGVNDALAEQSRLENKLWRLGYKEGRKLNP